MPTLLHAESQADDSVMITVAGVVAYHNPDQIPGAVRAAVARWTPPRVFLDVGDVSMLDGAGIAALLAGYQVGADADIPVTLVNVGAFLSMQLRESGVHGLLCPSDADADDDVPTMAARPRALSAASADADS